MRGVILVAVFPRLALGPHFHLEDEARIINLPILSLFDEAVVFGRLVLLQITQLGGVPLNAALLLQGEFVHRLTQNAIVAQVSYIADAIAVESLVSWL